MLFIRQLTIIVYAMMVVVVQTSLHGADDTIAFIIIHTECTAGARWIFITYHKQIYVLSKQMNYMQVYKVVMETKIVVPERVVVSIQLLTPLVPLLITELGLKDGHKKSQASYSPFSKKLLCTEIAGGQLTLQHLQLT